MKVEYVEVDKLKPFERNPKVIIDRWEEFTGQKAEKL